MLNFEMLMLDSSFFIHIGHGEYCSTDNDWPKGDVVRFMLAQNTSTEHVNTEHVNTEQVNTDQVNTKHVNTEHVNTEWLNMLTQNKQHRTRQQNTSKLQITFEQMTSKSQTAYNHFHNAWISTKPEIVLSNAAVTYLGFCVEMVIHVHGEEIRPERLIMVVTFLEETIRSICNLFIRSNGHYRLPAKSGQNHRQMHCHYCWWSLLALEVVFAGSASIHQ